MEVAIKTMEQLKPQELWEIFMERTRVFVVEQNCPYQEVDDIDPQAWHLTLRNDQGQLVAYSRIFRNGDQADFGRVLVPKEFRGQGHGRQLVAATIRATRRLLPGREIVIEGQAYLKDFYQSFGMQAISAEFLIDGIPHIRFSLPAETSQDC